MNRASLLATSFTALCLAGCANDAALQAAKSETLDTYKICLQTAAQRLDDGTQELLTVALAVKAACGNEFLAWARASSAHLSSGYQALFVANVEPKALESAATAVATNRTRRR